MVSLTALTVLVDEENLAFKLDGVCRHEKRRDRLRPPKVVIVGLNFSFERTDCPASFECYAEIVTVKNERMET